jgi:hypothetical protein
MSDILNRRCVTRMLKHLNKPLYSRRSFRFPRISLVWFTGVSVNTELYIHILRRLRDKVRIKPPKKKENQRLVSPTQRSSTPVDFGFLSKELSNNKWDILHTPLTWLQPIFTYILDWNQHLWDGGAFLILVTLRMRRKSWKGFHRMTSRNVTNTFTFAGRSVYLHKRATVNGI